MRTARWMRWLPAAGLVVIPWGVAMASNGWPNGPDDDPRDAMPNDPSYFSCVRGPDNVCTTPANGEWNIWSFYPESWDPINQGTVREEERTMGVGMHADRGWQLATGRPEVIIAVLDSGIRWRESDLVNRFYLHRPELDTAACRPKSDCEAANVSPTDSFDVNGDGRFNVQDYLVCGDGAALDQAGNRNGMFDPEDLILTCSDGTDADGNGYVDDISGWDFYRDDNNPADDTDFGHGTGEAKDSAAEGNNGNGGIGVCPDCTLLMMRASDSFVADVNDFSTSVIYATDMGASVIQEALGSINMNELAYQAIDYAYRNNTVVIASAADELSYHHNMPGTANHTVYVHAIVHDDPEPARSTTFLNYNNCTNHGAQLLMSTPGGGCSSEATGKTSGQAGLMYSYGLDLALDPPLSAEEIRGLILVSADDINVNPENDDPEKFPSDEGWDFHFGYGRNNVRGAMDLMRFGMIPPEADIETPYWFETFYPRRDGATVEVTGRVGTRTDGAASRYDSYRWTFSVAAGHKPEDSEFEQTDSGTTTGIDGRITSLDVTDLLTRIDVDTPPGLNAGPEADSADRTHAYAFTMKLRVCADGAQGETCNEFRKLAFLDDDPDLYPGFPIHIVSSGEASGRFRDLDGDGKDELVLPTADGRVHAFRFDGTQAPGFPVSLGWRRGFVPASERSRFPELGGDHYAACAFRTDKTGCRAKVGSITAPMGQTVVTNALAIADLDRADLPPDEQVDVQIVATTFDGYVWVFNRDGSLVPGFPVRTDPENTYGYEDFGRENRLDEGIAGGAVLADLDDDGDYEIIVAAMDQHVYVWHHDGTPHAGFPVLCRDLEEENGRGQGAHIMGTPAVGDIDADGELEILIGTNEVYGGQSRLYILHPDGNLNETERDGRMIRTPFEDLDPDRDAPGPARTTAIIGEVLPLVGRGNPSNPVIADYDFDGLPEFLIEGVGGTPRIYEWDGEKLRVERIFDPATYGVDSDSVDSFTYTLINNGAFAFLDDSGDMTFIKGAAGLNFALAFAEGGRRAYFDHQVSAWNMFTGKMLPAYPRVQDDWQFFMTPTIVDIDNDGFPEVINGTGGYRLRAMDYRGREPSGWPKHTGGWIIASSPVGDFDGDGKYDVAVNTRNGWLFVFRTQGDIGNDVEWNGFGHDERNTNNYETPMLYRGERTGPGPGDDVGPDVGPDAGTAEPPESDVGVSTDTTPDVAQADAAPDAGGVDTSGSDTSETDTTPAKPRKKKDEGCSSTSAPATPWALAVALLGLAVRRRRRQST